MDHIRFRDPVRLEAMLHTQEEILDVSHLQMWVDSSNIIERSESSAAIWLIDGGKDSCGDRASVRKGTAGAQGERGRWLRATLVDAGADSRDTRRIARLRVTPIRVASAVEENAGTAANGPVRESEWLPGKAEARRKVAIIQIDKWMMDLFARP
jgi:hypothetical protein